MTAEGGLRDHLERRQIVIYFAAVLLGFVLAAVLPASGRLERWINPALALMLFVTFLQVPLARLRGALTDLRFIAALLVVNFVLVPLLVGLLLPMLPGEPLLRLAFLFVLLCPCIDYVVTFSHLGKSDSSLLLAATPLLLLVQMLLLPVYLGLLMGPGAAALVRPGPFIEAFVWLVAVPLALAALLQMVAARSAVAGRVSQVCAVLPVPVTALVLLVVIAVVAPQLAPAMQAAKAVLPFYGIFALLMPLLGLAVAAAFGLRPAAARAIAFSGATRNSLVVLPLALSIPGALPIVPAVIVTQTLVELLATLLYIPLIPRLSRWRSPAQ